METKLRQSDDRCARLHQIMRRLERHPLPPVRGIPGNGLYFMFEKNEMGHEGDRIVRIGSHTGNGNLSARLLEHITQKKDRSIFRKNIGRALLSKNGDRFLEQWDLDLTKRVHRTRYEHLVDATKMAEVESAVSDYIGKHVSVSVIRTNSETIALNLERLCIATVSLCRSCCASVGWLGSHSPKVKIQESGLWQIQHLSGEPLTIQDLRIIEGFVSTSRSAE